MKRRWCRARVRSDLPQSALDLRVPRQSSDNGGSTPVQAGLGNSRRSSLVGEEPSMDRDTLSPGPGQAGAIEAGRVLRLSSRPAVYETARLTTQTELVWAFSADLSRNRLLGTARVRHGEIRCGTVRLATCWQRSWTRAGGRARCQTQGELLSAIGRGQGTANIRAARLRQPRPGRGRWR